MKNDPPLNYSLFLSVKMHILYMYWYIGACSVVDKVCDYFGVKIALYFAYLGHYTASLLWPAILGFIFWLLSDANQVQLVLKCKHFSNINF